MIRVAQCGRHLGAKRKRRPCQGCDRSGCQKWFRLLRDTAAQTVEDSGQQAQAGWAVEDRACACVQEAVTLQIQKPGHGSKGKKRWRPTADKEKTMAEESKQKN